MTYKIFFEDKKIILTNKLKKSYKKKYPIYTKEKISIPDFLKKIENHSSGKFIFFIEDKKERLLDEFALELTKVAAAGGVGRPEKMCPKGGRRRNRLGYPFPVRTPFHYLSYL